MRAISSGRSDWERCDATLLEMKDDEVLGVMSPMGHTADCPDCDS